jgi:hypothetical protein
MTWLAPIPLFPDAGAECSAAWPLSSPVRDVSTPTHSAAYGMSSASAMPVWRWVSPAYVPAPSEPIPANSPVAPARVRIPADLVRRMSREACLTGKSESEVWAEAARAWLQRHERDDDFPPTPPAAAQPCPRRERAAWVAIDALLLDLRAEPAAA